MSRFQIIDAMLKKLDYYDDLKNKKYSINDARKMIDKNIFHSNKIHCTRYDQKFYKDYKEQKRRYMLYNYQLPYLKKKKGKAYVRNLRLGKGNYHFG